MAVALFSSALPASSVATFTLALNPSIACVFALVSSTTAVTSSITEASAESLEAI